MGKLKRRLARWCAETDSAGGLSAPADPDAVDRGTAEEPDAELEKLAVTLSKESLEEQERVLKDLRTSSASLLTASCLVASFLGAQALSKGGLGVLAILALSTFFLAIGAAVVVLLPRSKDQFSLNGSEVYRYFYDHPHQRTEADLVLASWTDALWESNQRRLRTRFWIFRAGAGLLVAETVLWAVHLGGSL